MQDRLHPETSAAAGLLVALIIMICGKFGIIIDSTTASELTIVTMWLVQRLARKFFPEESSASTTTTLTIEKSEDSPAANK